MQKHLSGTRELWRESPEAAATSGCVTPGWGRSRPRKPGKWVGGRGKRVTRSPAPTFRGDSGYYLPGLCCLFFEDGAYRVLRHGGKEDIQLLPYSRQLGAPWRHNGQYRIWKGR